MADDSTCKAEGGEDEVTWKVFLGRELEDHSSDQLVILTPEIVGDSPKKSTPTK